MEDLRERQERSMYLKWYAPSFVVAYLLIGYLSGRWGTSLVAAAVVAMPASLAAWWALCRGMVSGVRVLTRP